MTAITIDWNDTLMLMGEKNDEKKGDEDGILNGVANSNACNFLPITVD